MDFKELLSVVVRIQESIEGAGSVKKSMRTRMEDYSSVLKSFESSTPDGVEHELKRLRDLFEDIEDLHKKHTGNDEDGKVAKLTKIVNRGTQHKSIGDALDAIDRDVVRQFNAIAAKSSINTEEMKTLLAKMQPPPLPDTAAVPAGALALPANYVERPGFGDVVDDLVNTEEAHTPYTIVGMGGQGKTVLASAVVRNPRVGEHFRGGIFWVKVGRGAKDSLLSLLQGLAREIGAAPTDASHSGVPQVLDSLEKVKQHLAVVASAGSAPRLVVLDDVWESEIVDAFLPLQLKVLVTTRDVSVVGVMGSLLELRNMAVEEAVELLVKTSAARAQPPIYVRAKVAEVAALCGYLPLALAIAGSMSVVKGKGLTVDAWEELIELFGKQKSKMMRSFGEQTTSLNMVLGTSFDVLSERRQEEMMKMGVMAPGVVASTEMLLNLWETTDLTGTRDEAKGLTDKCLLQDVGGDGYRVHDLLLDFVRIKIKLEPEMVTRATERQAQYLRRLDVVKGFESSEHGLSGQGLFFLATLWRSVEELSGNPELQTASYRASLEELKFCDASEEVASSYFGIGNLFHRQGKHSEAEPLYERTQAILEEVLGLQHPKVAGVLMNRAALFGTQGKYAEAESLYVRSQAIKEQGLGLEHPELAGVLMGRAGLLQTQGKYAEAEPLYERLQAIQEEVLDPEHLDVARVFHNRGGLLIDQGKYAEADALLQRSQAILKAVLGSEHPDVATALQTRGATLHLQGQYSQAELLYEESQRILEKVLGPKHPQLALVLTARATLLRDQMKYAEAEPLYEMSQAIYKKTLGPKHPSFAEVLHKRALLFQAQKKFAEAEPLYKEAQTIYEDALGQDQPDVARVVADHAGLFAAQGKYSQAGPLYERSQAALEKTLGERHPNVADVLLNRAVTARKQDKYDEAELLFKRSQAILEEVVCPDHPGVANVLNERAQLLHTQGKYAEAGPLYEKAQAIREKVLGPDHSDVANLCSNRGSALKMQKKYVEAESFFKKSRAIREKVLGMEHLAVASVLIELAEVLHMQDKDTEAELLLERSLVISEKELGPEDPTVANILRNRILVMEKQGKYVEAQPFYEKLRAIRRKAQTARDLNIKAALLLAQGKYAGAEELCEMSQAIQEKLLGPEHTDVTISVINRAVLSQMQGKYANSVKLWEKAFLTREMKLGDHHPDTVIARKNLENARIQVAESW